MKKVVFSRFQSFSARVTPGQCSLNTGASLKLLRRFFAQKKASKFLGVARRALVLVSSAGLRFCNGLCTHQAPEHREPAVGAGARCATRE